MVRPLHHDVARGSVQALEIPNLCLGRATQNRNVIDRSVTYACIGDHVDTDLFDAVHFLSD